MAPTKSDAGYEKEYQLFPSTHDSLDDRDDEYPDLFLALCRQRLRQSRENWIPKDPPNSPSDGHQSDGTKEDDEGTQQSEDEGGVTEDEDHHPDSHSTVQRTSYLCVLVFISLLIVISYQFRILEKEPVFIAVSDCSAGTCGTEGVDDITALKKNSEQTSSQGKRPQVEAKNIIKRTVIKNANSYRENQQRHWSSRRRDWRLVAALCPREAVENGFISIVSYVSSPTDCYLCCLSTPHCQRFIVEVKESPSTIPRQRMCILLGSALPWRRCS